ESGHFLHHEHRQQPLPTRHAGQYYGTVAFRTDVKRPATRPSPEITYVDRPRTRYEPDLHRREAEAARACERTRRHRMAASPFIPYSAGRDSDDRVGLYHLYSNQQRARMGDRRRELVRDHT